MSCINFSNKPTHSQLKTRPSNQSFGTCKTISLHQALLHKITLLLHRSRSPTSPLLSRTAARAWGQQTASGPPPDPQDSSEHGHLHHPETCCLQLSNTNPAGDDAGHQTGSDQWPRGQHEPRHRYLASSASGRAPGCPRRDQRPDRRLGGSSHQAGPGVPWGSEPEPQRLWPSH